MGLIKGLINSIADPRLFFLLAVGLLAAYVPVLYFALRVYPLLASSPRPLGGPSG